MPKRSKSSARWLQEHFKDPYVQQAQREGYRGRAVYKLLEIHQKDRLFKPGMVIVDLGAAPGSWAEMAFKLTRPKGRIIATDRLSIEPILGVEFIQGDFTEDEVLATIFQAVGGAKVDLVMSDMAPNVSGIKAVDQPRMILLAELALDFASQVLREGGDFLVKLFQGEGFDEYVKQLRQHFQQVSIRKPKASRARSKELYLLARKLKRMV